MIAVQACQTATSTGALAETLQQAGFRPATNADSALMFETVHKAGHHLTAAINAKSGILDQNKQPMLEAYRDNKARPAYYATYQLQNLDWGPHYVANDEATWLEVFGAPIDGQTRDTVDCRLHTDKGTVPDTLWAGLPHESAPNAITPPEWVDRRFDEELQITGGLYSVEVLNREKFQSFFDDSMTADMILYVGNGRGEG